MRVVEPKKFSKDTPERVASPNRKKKRVVFGILPIALVIGAFFMMGRTAKAPQEAETLLQPSQNETQPVETSEATEQVDNVKDTLRLFSDNEFKLFYDNLRQPDLEPVSNPPTISGNDIADTRIREIAEQRGYRLRSSPSGTLNSVDGQRLQPVVIDHWNDLKAAAAKKSLSLSLVSGYRSVNDQRALFLQRLSATGATIEEVASGSADALVNKVLVTSSIPGYSKHHTGYTIDMQCGGYGFENFKNSPCNDWLSAENYKVAKEHGFIPSYPPLADVQGPDPEAWEYVYVGTDLLYE